MAARRTWVLLSGGPPLLLLLHLLLLLLAGCARLAGAFNLDHDSVLRKDGDPGSYFGFSMAMHRQVSPTDKRMRGWLVGWVVLVVLVGLEVFFIVVVFQVSQALYGHYVTKAASNVTFIRASEEGEVNSLCNPMVISVLLKEAYRGGDVAKAEEPRFLAATAEPTLAWFRLALQVSEHQSERDTETKCREDRARGRMAEGMLRGINQVHIWAPNIIPHYSLSRALSPQGALAAYNGPPVPKLPGSGTTNTVCLGFLCWWLLVGAPRAKALSRQTSKVTGGLYNCDFSDPSNSCKRVDFDNDENPKVESKENQWMGVTVNSQGPGGMVVTCAHRYQKRKHVKTADESREITGRCYTFSQHLTIAEGSDEENGNWHFCNGRLRGHERFGSCQQGLSATFDKNYHYLIFGAPGAYNWKGVVRLEQRNNTLFEMGIYSDGPFETGDESKMDPTLVPVPPTSYLGFSLDSGMAVVEKETLTVVAGAPRANHSGAVLLMKKGTESNILLADFILEGEGLASSFGYDLAVLDLNKDGWMDIVVGAPQYFEKDKTIGGVAYVYINKAGAWDKVTPTRIDGPENSMFGLAVENLGDINQDLYHDFAVGAPYDDGGAGAVYIYHGSAEGLSSKEASQTLQGKPMNAKLFGYSLAGNMDLDLNNYPDMAVGSLSDSVFVYRLVG
ncbi:Integrin alpha-6 [Merluccius polli]|uniref:Integrin alpha-6 n=1 Tax=Merluccius polli TaxID=89951 RepID=A0AA47MR27_MERPO|nr:Integrin alpha-6 [Merluccius polli]